jgi:hypothetical protein
MFQVDQYLLKLADVLVKIVASYVHPCDLARHILNLLVQLITALISALQFLFQYFFFTLEVFLKLELLIVKVFKFIVESRDAFHLGLQDFFMVLFELEVVHLSVTLVTDPVEFLVGSGQHPSCYGADIADTLTAPLAVSDWVLSKGPCEVSLAQHASRSGLALDCIQVELDRKVVVR